MTAEMTAHAFESLARKIPRIKAENVAIARLVLVDGNRIQDVADLHGVQKQLVNRHVQRFRREALQVPVDWVAVDGYFPPAIAEKLYQFSEELKTAAASGSTINLSSLMSTFPWSEHHAQ